MGSHPIPSEKSVNATGVMLEMLKKTTPDDLVIGLISGGGSALMTYPVEEIGLAGLQKTTSLAFKMRGDNRGNEHNPKTSRPGEGRWLTKVYLSCKIFSPDPFGCFG